MSLVGLVVNPVAGRGRGRHAGRAVHDRLTGAGHAVRDLSGPTLAHSADRARAAVLAGLDALVVVGGDGMVHLGVGLVAGTTLPLGVVAVGTGNDAARALGLPRGDVRAATDVVDAALRASRTRTVDAARTGRPGAGAREWFLGVLSCGLDAAVNARANTLRRPQGNARYLAALVPELARFRPYGYRVRVDDVVWEQPGTLVAVANAPWFGGGLHVAPDARLDDGLLDVVLAGAFTRGGALGVFPRLYGGTHVRDGRVRVLRGRAVVVEPAPQHGPPPPPAFADGERIGPAPLAVECVPGAVHVLV
ncbi:diacylglycerol/lipid kinase family protein [Cellulomonas oligotrophica]|uniref:Diacylglycerol kinase (ATP) n=1 Tax=Cellulomonas oligotrophica TaxID=931536 RepID=A0A7Y9FCZ4_9CELL|nr:diacylglycerol kinase family protein [Cellulomonas oligotrophica]NYD84742.1 diacylglycerol kinase (ATP) [Cellulomonas oligotrophica]GIG31810.1 sphingosine kinase [Cellulomonas oligotrophica]